MESRTNGREALKSYGIVAKMAFRNLARHKKATFLLGGVVGFGIMIVSLMQGCAGSLMANISANLANLMAGHVFVQGVEKLPSGKEFDIIRDDSALMDALAASGIKAKYVSKRAEFQATLIFEGNSSMQAVSGVDFGKETYLTERLVLAQGSFKGMQDEKGIIISQSMAKDLKARQGDRILAQLKTFSGQQNLGEFVIVAVVHDAGLLSLSSMSAYANIAYVNKLLNLPQGSYQQLSFYLPDMRNLDADGAAFYAALKSRAQVFDRTNASDARAAIMSRLRGGKGDTWEGVRYRVQTINDRLSGVQDLVNGINVASLIALAVLFFVIMVGISNTFRMIMLDRIREIGTMRALGMQKPQVLSLFLNEAIFLSLGGALAGLALALLVMLGFSLYDFGLESFLAIILRNGHLTFDLSPLLVLANVAIIAVLTFLAALVPARMAASLEPAQALRTVK
jgi:putative ABC transport system permease protein